MTPEKNLVELTSKLWKKFEMGVGMDLRLKIIIIIIHVNFRGITRQYFSTLYFSSTIMAKNEFNFMHIFEKLMYLYQM